MLKTRFFFQTAGALPVFPLQPVRVRRGGFLVVQQA